MGAINPGIVFVRFHAFLEDSLAGLNLDGNGTIAGGSDEFKICWKLFLSHDYLSFIVANGPELKPANEAEPQSAIEYSRIAPYEIASHATE